MKCEHFDFFAPERPPAAIFDKKGLRIFSHTTQL